MDPRSLKLIPNRHKTQKICEKAAKKYPWLIEYVPDHLKTQEICNKVAVGARPWL